MVAKLARSQRTASRASVPDEPALLKVGDLLAGKYRVQRLLGEGGMGIVVEAHHELLDQRVAVKLLYRDVADAEAESRLLMEARSAAKLQSEHVARVIDVDVGKDGLPFIVMELLEGGDLCQLADARGALPRWLVVDYVLQALEGLAHAHARGIIHRDLKPSNLFLATKPDGSQIIKILDFGISKSSDAPTDRHTQQLTGGRTMLGSPPYMSPEQVRSPKNVDHRTDIWSLGICMYELLTNSMPFGGDELQETFAQILEREPAPIRALVAGVPEGLEQVVMKCLAKNREDRFADVAELAAALAPFGSGTWTQSAERVQAILARALMDELASGPRVRGGAPSSDRIAIPSSPGRRLDSIQPELHGTASTVARRFTVFDSKRRWVVAGIAAPAIVGLSLIGLFAFGKGTTAPEVDLAARSEPPSAAVEPPPPSAPASPVTNEKDTSPGMQGTVVGASPMPDATSKTNKPGASPTNARAVAPPARTVAKPPTSAKALPAGLPQTRSGQ
ncbi:MAG TPA: serine/threonine-protein kinase [Labilithrix sp.]|nr:serine/threonine-protein kinase [Labilithrix sp.]